MFLEPASWTLPLRAPALTEQPVSPQVRDSDYSPGAPEPVVWEVLYLQVSDAAPLERLSALQRE